MGQHAHVRDEYHSDLDTMLHLANYTEQYPEAAGSSAFLSGIAEKLRPIVDEETDFTIEMQNQERVRENFKNSDVVIPEALIATEKVLIMECLNGRTAADIHNSLAKGDPVDSHSLGREQRDMIYNAFGTMMLVHEFYQMDAHPGNLMLMEDGKVGILDFGQCAQTTKWRQNLIDFLQQAPMSLAEIANDSKATRWLQLIGIDTKESDAKATAEMLIYGKPAQCFPITEKIDPDAMSIILIFLYLSRLEKTASMLRKQREMEDESNPFAVLQAFQHVCRTLPTHA